MSVVTAAEELVHLGAEARRRWLLTLLRARGTFRRKPQGAVGGKETGKARTHPWGENLTLADLLSFRERLYPSSLFATQRLESATPTVHGQSPTFSWRSLELQPANALLKCGQRRALLPAGQPRDPGGAFEERGSGKLRCAP